MNNIKYSLLIVLAAFIWGSAFVAQSVGMDYIGPFMFNAFRFTIGGIVLIPVVLIFKKKNPEKPTVSASGNIPFASLSDTKRLIVCGIICGIILCTASSFQQVGIQYTTPGKSGFITSLYVIMVPLFGLFSKEKPGFIMWIGALISMVGMYLLCVSESLSLNKGDILTFFCAVFFAIHIIVIGKFAPYTDGIKLSCIQFFTAGVISSVIAPIVENLNVEMLPNAIIPILYAGVLSCGVAFTLQTVAQQKVNPVLCSLLFSLESVFSVLTSWLILHERLTAKEIAGCILVFAAVVLVQTAPLLYSRSDNTMQKA
ncbi:MAG: DMT family transporter [Lachnospiraceae bacterium]|nr:DMT family transporter [Lachnospiraceae bacterium]